MNHKSFDFTQLGGFPLEQERLSWMQQSYSEALQAVNSLIGDNVIVSGCVVLGGNVTDGWVVVDGELLPFKGGVKQDTFSIRNISTALEFEDASFRDVQFYKYCEFGTDNPIRFDSLTRLKTIKSMTESIHDIDTSIVALHEQIYTGSITAEFPVNMTGFIIEMAAPDGINPKDYIGYLNFGITTGLISSTYLPHPNSIQFFIRRDSSEFLAARSFDFYLIKKQN